MSRRRLSTKRAEDLISAIKERQPKIVFYTEKIKISLPNMESIQLWKKRYPKGIVRFS
jgi:hypothetical protein